MTELIRAVFTRPPAIRAEDDTGDGRPHLVGHFAVFDTWTEVDSWFEGHFMERISPGAFRKSMKERRSQIKVLYDHGFDPSLGQKPLGPISELKEDEIGGWYDVSLIDTDYNRDFIIPAASEPGLLGASFRFEVVKESWDRKTKSSEYNPAALPERTIKEVRLFELGPVTFPAYEAATAGVRSRADFDLWRNLDDEGRLELSRFIRATQRTPNGAASDTPPGAVEPTEEPPRHSEAITQAMRRQRLLTLRS